MAFVQPSSPCDEQKVTMESLGFTSLYTHHAGKAVWGFNNPAPLTNALLVTVSFEAGAKPTAAEAILAVHKASVEMGKEQIRTAFLKLMGASPVTGHSSDY
jgi:hypothetical protein